MKTSKMDRPNESIKCSVNTCYYYMQGDHCTAQQIQVEPRESMSSEETDCATFFPGSTR